MQHHAPPSRAASVLALCFALTACGGGGSGTHAVVPPSAASSAPSGSQREAVTVRIAIPAPAAAGKLRSPKYISASTASIQLNVSGPNSASASAEIDVNTTTCPSAVCSLTVSAPVGSDTFSITTYDAPGGASGSGHVLSTVTQPATVVLHAANTFNFTLGGVTARVKVTLDNAYLPTGVPGSATATIAVLDAGGNQILGTYQNPVTLSAGSGAVTLAKTTFPDSSVATTAVTFSGNSRAAVSIAATDGTHQATAILTPTSNTIWLPIAGSRNGDSPFKMIVGPDGRLYYGQLGQTSPVTSNFVAAYQPGRIGVIDPATNTITEYPIGFTRSGAPNVGADPIQLRFKPGTNDLYLATQESGSIARIANATTTGLAAAAGASSPSFIDQPLAPQPSGGNTTPNVQNGDATPRSFDFSADGTTLYAGTFGGHAIAVIPVSGFGSATPAYVPMPASVPPANKNPQGLVARNGNVYFIEQNGGNPNVKAVGVMSEANRTSSGITEFTDTVIGSRTIAGLRSLAPGADGNLYITWYGDATLVQTPLHFFNPANGTFTAVPVPDGLPFDADSLQPSNVPGSVSLVFNDLVELAVGVHNTTLHTTTLIPAYNSLTPPVTYPNDAVQTTPDDFWFTGNSGPGPDGRTPTSPPLIGHIALAAGWSVFPQINGPIPIYGTGDPNAFLFAVLEQAAAADTFTLASSAPGICSVAAIAKYPGDYKVVGLAPGSCTVTVTDQNRRSVALTFQVTTQTASINSRMRMAP